MLRKLKYGILCIGVIVTALLLQCCANMVTPSGGAKDTKPPVVTEAVPENNSLNFSGKKIEITFDEFVTLENANQNVLISPPLATKPDIKLSGKTVVIRFKEPLKPNTTYSINFGNAIKDLHEGNLFQNYLYTFSTGNALDSLSIAGTVLNALDKKPVNEALVGLYADHGQDTDTLPCSLVPDYITKTDKDGKFHFSGLADKKYLVFALKDANSNLYYDLPNEEVAFIDSLVPAVYEKYQPKKARTATDSIVSDSLPADAATEVERSFDMKAMNLTLYMFVEQDTTQMLLEKKLIEEGLLRFVFRQPAQEVSIETPEILPDAFQIVRVPSLAFDTVQWYFTPNIKDSLWIQVNYNTLIHDSTRYSLVYKDPKRQNRRNVEPETLKASYNTTNNILLPEKEFTIRFSEPVVSIHMPDSAYLIEGKDTLWNHLEFEKADEFGFLYRLKNKILHDVNYVINIPDSAFFGIRGRTNGNMITRFHRAKDEEYGNIFITVNLPQGLPQAVVQLIGSNNAVIDTQVVTESRELEFWYLMPGKYRLKAIYDTDANGKWSTGNYHRHALPETIVDYKDELDLKAGWDIDLDTPWDL